MRNDILRFGLYEPLYAGLDRISIACKYDWTISHFAPLYLNSFFIIVEAEINSHPVDLSKSILFLIKSSVVGMLSSILTPINITLLL